MEPYATHLLNTKPQARSPSHPSTYLDPRAIHLTDLFLVAYLDMNGHRVEPFVSDDGPYDLIVSFNVYGEVAKDMDDFHDRHTMVYIADFIKAYKSVRAMMWNMKQLAKSRIGEMETAGKEAQGGYIFIPRITKM